MAVDNSAKTRSLDRGALSAERERKLDLKKRALEAKRAEAAAAKAGATTAQGQVGRIDRAATLGRRGVRQAAAKRLAGAMAGTPSGSGAQLAMATQQARDLGAELGEFELGVESMRAQREREAAQARLGAAEAESAALQFEAADVASATADTQMAMKDAGAAFNQIVEANKGFFDDDEEGMSRALLERARIEDDPTVADYYRKKAMDVLNDPDSTKSVQLSDGTIYRPSANPVDV